LKLRRGSRGEVSATEHAAQPAETEPMLFPSERLDGEAFLDSPSEPPAFVGHIDEPAEPEVSSRGLAVVRARGWAISTRGRALRVRVGVDDLIEVGCDQPRPEVPIALAGHFGDVPDDCGWVVHVPLPEPGTITGSVALHIEIDDGEFVTRRRFRVALTDEAAPVRADYKSTWDAVAGDVDSAKVSVSGYTDEDEYERTAHATVRMLRETVGLDPDDEILEIGCGVGRAGAALAPQCKRWVGADVSANMLGHARERLRGLDNVELVELNGWDLSGIPDDSLDLVYCTIVFMHLDEWERFSYVKEAMRVLRPGGRVHIDNFNLCSDAGWAFFMEMSESYHPLGRPPNISKSSTPDELRTYLERAGFVDIEVLSNEGLFAHAWGVAP
jgi:SAM-dependent methyltransferase